MDEFPTTVEMLCDLSKVEGLEWVFQMLAMIAQIDPGILTDGERAVIESMQPIPYTLTDAGRALLDGAK